MWKSGLLVSSPCGMLPGVYACVNDAGVFADQATHNNALTTSSPKREASRR